MHNKIIEFLMMVGLMVCPMVNHADLLWWFEDPDIYDWRDDTVKKTSDFLDVNGNSPNLVRIGAHNGDDEILYLNLYDSGMKELGIDGYALPDFFSENKAGPAFADLSRLGPISDETQLVFVMELGFAEFDADFDIVKWHVVANASETYRNLVAGGHILDSELSFQDSWAWSPGMTVPEPSTGLLLLLGSAILALKRKRI